MIRFPGTDDVGDDVALTRAAQAGDVAALGLLLERHRAGMRAVALSILGPGPDADDVMQDAALAALSRIAQVRDPQAVGAWLRMIVRNRCRGVLRDVRRVGRLDTLPSALPDLDAGPEEVLERHAMRDWVWEAIEQLSPTLRLPLVLRHFTEGVTGYERIAQVCGVPVGTVRSRLSQARGKLSDALADTAAGAHSDARVRTAASWQEAHDTLAAAEAGDFGGILAREWSPEVALIQRGARLGGADFLNWAMDDDLAAGVRQRPVKVTAARSIAVWEMEIIRPAEDRHPWSSSVAWIMTRVGGRMAQLRLFHPGPIRPWTMPEL